MRTIVTDATPNEIAKLAGVVWRAPTPECRVVFGDMGGELVGVEPVGELWAVHVDEAVRESFVKSLDGWSVFGAEVFSAVTGLPVPHIGGGAVEETIDGAPAVAVSAGKAVRLEAAEAEACCVEARAVAGRVAEEVSLDDLEKR